MTCDHTAIAIIGKFNSIIKWTKICCLHKYKIIFQTTTKGRQQCLENKRSLMSELAVSLVHAHILSLARSNRPAAAHAHKQDKRISQKDMRRGVVPSVVVSLQASTQNTQHTLTHTYISRGLAVATFPNRHTYRILIGGC